MSQSIRLAAEPVRELAWNVVGPAYSTIGGPMQHPIRFIVIQNLTDTGIMISLDGVTDHLPLTENGYTLLDITVNKTTAQGFFLAEGQQLYAKEYGAPATLGSVYVSAFYGAEI